VAPFLEATQLPDESQPQIGSQQLPIGGGQTGACVKVSLRIENTRNQLHERALAGSLRGASALARSYPPLLCRNDPGILN
jgi:hypothetical protein